MRTQKLSSFDRARCEHSRPTHCPSPPTRPLNNSITCQDISRRNIHLDHLWQLRKSLFVREQGIEHTPVTRCRHRASPRSRRGSSLLQRFPVVTWNVELCQRLTRNVCEPDTPNALLRQNPRSWTLAWFDQTCSEHRKFWTNHISSRPGERRESRCSGKTQIIHLETKHLSKSTPELPRFPSLHCCSQG